MSEADRSTPAREARVYDSMALAPTAEAYGVGPAWIAEELYYSDGSAWTLKSSDTANFETTISHGSGLNASKPTASASLNGLVWYSTDTDTIYKVVAGAWVAQSRTAIQYATDYLIPQTFGAAGDASTDDTAALQATFAAAQLLNKTVLLTSEYKITDELTVSGPIRIIGHRRGNLYNGGTTKTVGASIISFSTTAGKSIIKVSGTTGTNWPTAAFFELENVSLQYNAKTTGQYGIYVDGRISYGALKGVVIYNCGAEAIYWPSTTYYIQNFAIRDTLFQANGAVIGCGGTGLLGTLLQLHNVAVEAGGQGYSGLLAIMDLRRFREIEISTLVIEGAANTKPTAALALSCNNWAKIDGIHVEYSSNSPDYCVYIDDSNTYTSGLDVAIDGMVASLPIRVDFVNSSSLPARLTVQNWQYWTATSTSSLISGSANAKYFADLSVRCNSYFSVPVSQAGFIRLKTLYGVGSSPRVLEDERNELIRWAADYITPTAAAAGDFSEVWVSNGSSAVTTIKTDTTINARVMSVQCSTGNFPNVYIRCKPPSSYDGGVITCAVLYRVVTSSTFNMSALYNDVDKSASKNTNITDGSWNWAVGSFVYSSASAQPHFRMRYISGTISDAPELQIAAITAVMGSAPLIIPLKGKTKPIIARMSAVPTTGDWLVGDVVWFTAPTAGNAPGAVCVTAGTPGTWKNMAALSA